MLDGAWKYRHEIILNVGECDWCSYHSASQHSCCSRNNIVIHFAQRPFNELFSCKAYKNRATVYGGHQCTASQSLQGPDLPKHQFLANRECLVGQIRDMTRAELTHDNRDQLFQTNRDSSNRRDSAPRPRCEGELCLGIVLCDCRCEKLCTLSMFHPSGRASIASAHAMPVAGISSTLSCYSPNPNPNSIAIMQSGKMPSNKTQCVS